MRDADYADAPCKGRKYRAAFFRHKVIERKRQRGDIAHRRFALQGLSHLVVLRGIRHRVAGYEAVLEPYDA